MSTELKAQVLKALGSEGDRPGILERSGRVLMSGWNTVAPARHYVMGLNPGGELGLIPDAETIGGSLFEEPDADWCAFQDDPDFLKYRVVPDVLNRLGAPLRRTPITNLLFLRSPSWSRRPADSCDAFRDYCMPVHRLLLAEIKPCVIVAFGEDVGIWLTGVKGRPWGFDADFDWQRRNRNLPTGIDQGTGLLLLPHFSAWGRCAWKTHEDRLHAAIETARLHNPA